MPRLLSINSYHYRRGGSDVVYLDHAALMESIGWTNAFFSMHYPKNLPTKWARYFVDEIQYGHKYSIFAKAIMASKVVYSFEAQKKIERLVDDYRPNIAHTHCIYHHLSPSILPVLRRRGIPTVMTAHELKVNCPAYKMLNSKGICERCKDSTVFNALFHKCIKNALLPSALVAIESFVHRRLDIYRKNINRVITPSRFYYEKYVEWGWPKEQLIYVPNYVDAQRFKPNFRPGNHIVYFGRLSEEKGVATLIRAIAKAGAHLKLAGTGPEEVQLKMLAAELNASVEFLGYRSGPALHEAIGAARAVVLPSEWYENAPMSVLESFALGKPVAGANIGGIPELINDSTGWLFESRNVDHLACVLSEISATNDARLTEMGRAARKLVETTFNRSRYVSKVLGVYAELGVSAPKATAHLNLVGNTR